MNVVVDIPNSFSLYFNEVDIAMELKKNSALILYKQGKISLSKASELAGLNIYDFIKECKTNEIPVLDYNEDDIDKELNEIKKGLI